jgi:23S rRNA (uridine2552-2'-O)-methyltransferase
MKYNPKDAFYRKAKKEGYRSRAAYKLDEINRRFGLVRPGDYVVDLGAAPGGWLQVLARLVGKSGKVVGVDLQKMEAFKEPNITLLEADITAEETAETIRRLLGSAADCVVSDLAPRLSGIRDADLSRSAELVCSALRLSELLLKPGGKLLLKTFQGGGTDVLFAEIQKRFASAQRTRPEATRHGSSEIYFVARGFKPAPKPIDAPASLSPEPGQRLRRR